MKICAAQFSSFKGQFADNLARHIEFARLAASKNANLIVFPELSLTGYEPDLAKALATTQDDPRLNALQNVSNTQGIIICAGLPIRTETLPLIGMIIFTPNQNRKTYYKQYIHSDETPYFSPGNEEVVLKMGDLKIAPAICYESLLVEHSDQASKNGATIYFASVAKSMQGIKKASAHMPVVAKKHSMTVLMSNSLGPSDNFVGYGNSAVWNSYGECIGQLDELREALLILDTSTLTIEAMYI